MIIKMGDALYHAQSSAKLFGGVADDYIHIHTIMDSSKLFLADWRHRALLHNTFGMHLFEQLLGPSFKRKSDGVEVSTRTVVSHHILEDLGAIPTAGEFLREMPLRGWMTGINNETKKRMQSLTIEGDGTREAYVRADLKWTLNSSDHPDESGDFIVSDFSGRVFPGRFTEGEWYKIQPANLKKIQVAYWAEYPKSPVMPVNS